MSDTDPRIVQLVQDGWHRQRAIHWQKATLAALRSESPGESDEIAETVRDVVASPDLWRIHEEGPGGPDGWSYPVRVLECLYLTTRDAISAQERMAMNAVWWAMDGSSGWYLRVHCLDLQGEVVLAFSIDDYSRDLQM